MRPTIRTSVKPVVLALLAFAAAAPTAAQQFPVKPIRIVVPYSPGGVSDIASRLVGAKLTEAWGQQVVIDNKPGGNGTIGTSMVVKSPPDGYNLVVATVGDFTITQHLMKNIPYDPLVDLAPVMSLTTTPNILAATAASPFKSVQDVIAEAKKQNGKMSYASAGVGLQTHLLMEWFAVLTGTAYSHVPYKGGAPSGAAVAAGDVQIGLLAVQSAMPHIKSGKIRMLATTGATRSPIIPDVPTMRELGIKDIDGASYTLMLAPKGTPAPIIDRLNAEIRKALDSADLKEKLLAGASVPMPSTPAELAERLKRESAEFKVIVDKAKITAD